MDNLIVMRTFSMVGRSQTFSDAAHQLGISGSLVSRHVAYLEQQTGVRLVNRTTRSISLTEAGKRYHAFVNRIMRELEAEHADLARHRDVAEGALSIICPKWIGSHEVGDAIAAFSVAYPGIQLKFELGGMSERTYEFLDQGFDVAFSTRDLQDSKAALRKITDIPFVLAAAPSFLARYGTPATFLEAVTRFECLVHTNDPVWRLGSGADSEHHKVQSVALTSNSYLIIHKMAVGGRGICLLPRRSAMDELRSGELVELLPELPPPTRALYAVYGSDGVHDPSIERVRVFVEFVGDWFRRHDAAHPLDAVA